MILIPDLCWDSRRDLMVTGPLLAFFLKPTKGTLEFDYPICTPSRLARSFIANGGD
jgi:hypothetical protein